MLINSRIFFKEQAPVLPKFSYISNDIPVLDIEPSIGGSGGPSGHLIHFTAINTGEKVAIDCQWGIRGFGYEWRSPDKFVLHQDEKKKLEYKISNEKPFNEFVPELNIFFEYKDNRGVSYFTRRELVLKKVPSGAFYNITDVGLFHPAVILQDSKIRKISKPFMPERNFTTEVLVDVETEEGIKQVRIGFEPGMSGRFGFRKNADTDDDERITAALSELAQRKVRNMLREGNLQDHIFSSKEIPGKDLSDFEAYKALRDSLDLGQ